MQEDIKIGKKVFIRNAGKDEFWLQDVIYNNPQNLGLGDLIAIQREKKQVSGGRLDILLKSPIDNTMYEVECMLGETDPSHIIRAIEYWDNEKRKYPQRQHFCVLIAESFSRRYFNVIQLMSLNIPMIAIQADLIEVGDNKVLNFTKIINIYSEPDDENENSKQVNEATWNIDAPWVNSTSKIMFNAFKDKLKGVNIRHTQYYISININGKNDYWFHKRAKPNSQLSFIIKNEEKMETIKSLLSEKNVDFTLNEANSQIVITVDEESIKKYIDVLLEVHEIKYKIISDEE